MSLAFHFEIPESRRRELSDALAAADVDGTPRIRASCRWWRSWCEPGAHMLVVEGELRDDADVTVLGPFARVDVGEATPVTGATRG